MYKFRSRYVVDTGIVEVLRYRDGQMCVHFVGEEARVVVSVNLSDYGLVAPEGFFFTRDYAEAEGYAFALEEAGIADRMARFVFGPFDSVGYLMRLVV